MQPSPNRVATNHTTAAAAPLRQPGSIIDSGYSWGSWPTNQLLQGFGIVYQADSTIQDNLGADCCGFGFVKGFVSRPNPLDFKPGACSGARLRLCDCILASLASGV